jgi:glycosyltransferase involved in cell wall biosynthesis
MPATASTAQRLLFFSPMLAMPSQHGGCVYPHALLTELGRQGVAIDYAWLGKPLVNGRRWMRDPLNTPYVSTSWVRGTARLGSMRVPATLRGWLGEKTPTAGQQENGGEHTATPDEQAFAASVIRRLKPHRVLIDSTPMLTLLDTLSPAERARLHVSVLTHNLTWRRTELYRAAGQPLDFLPMTPAEEAALLSRADVIVAIQDREAEAFRAMLPGKKVVTVPMPFAPQPQPWSAAIPGRCLFVGGYSGHNIEAVKWLVSDIWPRVLAECPEAELIIAGTVGKCLKETPPASTSRIHILGPVDDLKAEYAKTSVCLVPLPLGTGLKIKLVEAMSYGRPVVTTPAGAEGFEELERGNVATVSDNAAGFASSVISVLTSAEIARTSATRQVDWIAQSLAPAAVARPLLS